MSDGESNPRLKAALAYAARGWRVLPIHSIQTGKCSCGGRPKCAPGKHPRNQNGVLGATTDPENIRAWWRKWPDPNLGVATGKGSKLVVMDIDPRSGGNLSLETLLDEHGPLPHTVEAITGSGGRHILFSHPGWQVKNINGLLAGLDIKGDGGYIVVEPSNHLSGNEYAWELSHLPDESPLAPMPGWLVDLISKHGSSPRKTLADKGVTERTERSERTEKTESNCSDFSALSDLSVVSVISALSVLSVTDVSESVAQAIAEAIEATIPDGQGQRNQAIFEFARALKAIPPIAEADKAWFRPIVQLWHRRAYPVIATKPFDETWMDFIYGFARVKFPKGQEPMSLIVSKAESADPPACASNYESSAVTRLIRFCRELQRAAGNGPFFLSFREAGRLVDLNYHQAGRVLTMLCVDGVLQIVQAHTAYRATRYRYTGGD